MKRIVVTGAGKSGFLGQHIRKAFLPYKAYGPEDTTRHYIMYTGSEYDLVHPNFANQLFIDLQPDILVHMAAVCGGILANKNSPADFLRDNTQMSLNIYKSAKRFGCKRVYTLGSVCSYPKYCPVPFKEDDLFNGYPEETNAPYGQAKRTLLMLGQTYREQYGIGGAHLIPVNMYGECFSKDTSLATPTGFKSVSDFKKGDLIYTLNPNTHETEVERVVATQKRKSSSFINFKGSVIDLRVTPEHKIYYKTNKTFLKRKAEWFIPRAGRSHGMIRFATSKGLSNASNAGHLPWNICTNESDSKVSLSDYIDDDHEFLDGAVRDYKHSHSHWIPVEYDIQDFYEFIGWYVSEGSRNSEKTSQISISQSLSNKSYRDEIGALITRMGLPMQFDDHRFYFSSRLWKNFIEAEIGTSCETKKIPEFLLHTNKELLEVLFDALMKGDGDRRGFRYSTKSETLKDQIILLAMLTGRKLGVVKKDKSGCWRVKFRRVRANSIKYRDILIEELDKTEDVYCVTTEKNHIVYAKRNSKCAWVGQCDHFDLVNSHVIPALINKFTSGSDVVKCWGTGEATREFLYAGDAAEAIVRAVLMDLDTPLPINIGTGKDISIKDLAYLIARLTNFKGQIEFTNDVSDGQPERRLDVSRAKKLLGFEAETDLETGLKKTIKWYLEQKNDNEEKIN